MVLARGAKTGIKTRYFPMAAVYKQVPIDLLSSVWCKVQESESTRHELGADDICHDYWVSGCDQDMPADERGMKKFGTDSIKAPRKVIANGGFEKSTNTSYSKS